MYYMETGSVDPAYNLAFEEYVLTRRPEGNYLMLWQNDRTVVVGRNQNTLEEINEDFIKSHSIRVVRRTTGGGAVYHDLGNLNYSFITDFRDDADRPIRIFTDAVVRALRCLGLDAEASGRNDILVSQKKVSGTAQRIEGKRILYHGTLLFDTDPETIARALHADPSKFESKSTKSVQSRVGCIRTALLGGPFAGMDIGSFRQTIREQLAAYCGEETAGHPAEPLTVSILNKEEIREVERLRDEKYNTWDWTYGRSPRFAYRNRKRFPGGTIEAGVNVAGGLITEIAIHGDFLALQPIEGLTQYLLGLPYEKSTLEKALSDISSVTDLRLYLGQITADELLSVML